jgi:hypothetical protein
MAISYALFFVPPLFACACGMASEPKLKRQYMRLNRKWFHGELPPDTEVYWEASGHSAFTTKHDDGHFIIKFDPGIAQYERYVEIVMLHECVHVEQWHYHRRATHGLKFWARIVQLFLQGAYKDLL